jgi:hypothetical protein
MTKRTKPMAARPKRAMNPHTPQLRAKTVPSAKKVASKRACRGRVVMD